MTTGIALIAIVLFIVIGFAVRAAKKNRMVSRLAAREALSDDEIYQRFYASQGLTRDSVIELWREIASTLRLDPSRLRPSDVLGRDVGTYWITSEELDVLGELAGNRAKKLGIQLDPSVIKTVDDYIRSFAFHK